MAKNRDETGDRVVVALRATGEAAAWPESRPRPSDTERYWARVRSLRSELARLRPVG